MNFNEWWLTKYSDSDLNMIRLIDSGDWREISSDSLDPMNVARRILSDKTLLLSQNSIQVAFIQSNAESLATKQSRIIMAGPRSGILTVIDGVHRIVAACLFHKVQGMGSIGQREAYVGLTDISFSMKFVHDIAFQLV